jgi:hypothetical protein
MRRLSLLVAVCAAFPLAGWADAVNQKERTYSIKYRDGSVERFKVKWQALRDMEVHEDGGPSTFTHPIDDRTCHWSINARVERRVYMVNRLGQEFGLDALTRAYNSDFTNQGASFMLVGLRSENCNDARGRRESDWNNAAANLNGRFGAITEGDYQSLKNEILRDLKEGTLVEN